MRGVRGQEFVQGCGDGEAAVDGSEANVGVGNGLGVSHDDLTRENKVQKR